MELIEPFEMNLGRNFDFIRIIGFGAYGLVCEYLDRALDCRVAVKKILKVDGVCEARRLLREIIFLNKLRHQKIVSLLKVLYGSFDSGFELYLIMELMDSDLHSLLSKNRA